MSLTFHQFSRWVAVMLDGEPLGYIRLEDNSSATLHLKKGAPQWIAEVRDRQPFIGIDACIAAIKNADPGHQPMLLNINSGSFGAML